MGNVTAAGTVDSGAELDCVDILWFKSHEVELGLTLRQKAQLKGCIMANNTVHRLLGMTVVKIQVGEAIMDVEFQVLDSGGALKLLLGKKWLHKIKAIYFHEVDCIDYFTNDDWHRLWNKNVAVRPTFTDLPQTPLDLIRLLRQNADLQDHLSRNPFDLARDLEQVFVEKELHSKPRNELVEGESDTGFLTEEEVQAASQSVLLTMASSMEEEFWGGIVEGSGDVSWASEITSLPGGQDRRQPLGKTSAT